MGLAERKITFLDDASAIKLKKYIDDSIKNINISAGNLTIKALTDEEIDEICV